MLRKKNAYISDEARSLRRSKYFRKARMYRKPGLQKVMYGKTITTRLSYTTNVTAGLAGVVNVYSLIDQLTNGNDWANTRGTFAHFNCIKVKAVYTHSANNVLTLAMVYDPSSGSALTAISQAVDYNNHIIKTFGTGANAQMSLMFRPRPKLPPPFLS